MDLIHSVDVPFYENQYAQYWFDNGILFQAYKDLNTPLTLDGAKMVVRDRHLITKGIPTLQLSDFGNVRKQSDIDVMKYFVSHESIQDVLACALCVNDYWQYAVVKFFLRFYRRQIPFPVEVVKSRREGVVWLQQFM